MQDSRKALTYSPDEFHAATLLALGEDTLTIVMGRATALEIAARDEESFEGATGRRSPWLRRASIAAVSKFGQALMELDAACTRLERAGMVAEAESLREREHRRIRALDRATQASA